MSGSALERRSASRFPIERELSYRFLGKTRSAAGSGKTINISSSGVLFTTEHELPVALRVEVVVNWPVGPEGRNGLRLVARGRVVRYELGRAAVEIQQYEFRVA